MNLRPYQQDCLNKTLEGFQAFRKQLCVLPTGGGKTIIFSHLARQIAPKKTLILAHRDELIQQACDKLHSATGIRAEVEKAEQKASLDAPVVVASIQSMTRRLDKYPRDHFGLVVADEAHRAMSDTWQKVLTYFDTRILGVTATPNIQGKKKLGEFFENIAYEISIFELIQKGYLSKISVQAIPISIDLGGVRRVAGDFDENQLAEAIGPWLEKIADAVVKIAQSRKCLAFLPLIATSKLFTYFLQQRGLRAEHIDGQSPDRKAILSDYANGKYQVLSNSMLLIEGYDEPSIDCIVCLRPTQNESLYQQICGRGTRIHPNKKDLLLLDFLWMHERHSLMRPANIFSKSEEEAKFITEQSFKSEDERSIEDLERDYKFEREATLARELASKQAKRNKNVDLMEYCLSLDSTDLIDWEPTMKWHLDPISDGQRSFLEKQGIHVDGLRGKGHASAIIEKIIFRRKANLATVKQVKWLKRFGHHDPANASFEEASAFLDSKFRKNKTVDSI